MKRILIFTIAVIMVSCGATKSTSSEKPLYEILVQKSYDGAKVKFYEIISQPDEFIMIKNDPDLKSKIGANDINTANFLILSMGEKPTGGYSIGIDTVTETDKNIIVTVKETTPKPGAVATDAFTAPYCVVRINSKKRSL
ncbi:protease complex subunit PrcB family protein [Flavobacterium sp. 3HN19-14]|uniref:protease complex subunit PrcB family protein n=1 Tax=Flavobacterium sp. 3HN19-14 TaxID=3448133 RepID=UPI003EDF1AD4